MPQHWKTYKLSDLAEIGSSKRIFLSEYVETGIPFFRSKEVIESFNKKQVSTELFISEEKFVEIEKKFGAPKEGDILLTSVGTIGVPFIIPAAYPKFYFKDGNLTWFKNYKRELIDPKFLFFLFMSPIGQQKFRNNLIGSTQQALTISSLREIEVTIPPLPEQRAIASILSVLDDKIELNLQMNKTLEEMAMALYKHWFVDFGHFKDGKFVESELGMIPEGWEVGKLKDCIDINPTLKLPKGKVAPFVEMKALPTDSMSVAEIDQKPFSGGSKFQNGDTLFARITPCLENGKTAYVDFLEEYEVAFGSTEFLVLRANENTSLYNVYLISREDMLRKHAISCMVGTSGRQRVQNEPFLNFSIPIAPKTVHEEFSSLVEDWFKLIRSNTIENQALKQQRDSLLPKLISGEIRFKHEYV